MNKLKLAIIISAIAMIMVFFVCDIKQWIWTPLTPYGMTHWIPEMLTIFLIGRWLIQSELKRELLYAIVGCIFLYPMLTYSLVELMQFGFGTSCLFTSVLIMGIWSGAK